MNEFFQCWSCRWSFIINVDHWNFPPSIFFWQNHHHHLWSIWKRKKNWWKKASKISENSFPIQNQFQIFFWLNDEMASWSKKKMKKKTSHHIYCVVFLAGRRKKNSYLKNYMCRQCTYRKDDEKIIWVMTSTSSIASVLNLEGKNFFFFLLHFSFVNRLKMLSSSSNSVFFILVTGNFSRYQSFDHQWSSSFVKEKKIYKEKKLDIMDNC